MSEDCLTVNIWTPQADTKSRPVMVFIHGGALEEGSAADSWYDGAPCIVLDYSKTSFAARRIRDEIREIAPGVFLGIVFWGRRHVLDFSLDFTR